MAEEDVRFHDCFHTENHVKGASNVSVIVRLSSDTALLKFFCLFYVCGIAFGNLILSYKCGNVAIGVSQVNMQLTLAFHDLFVNN